MRAPHSWRRRRPPTPPTADRIRAAQAARLGGSAEVGATPVAAPAGGTVAAGAVTEAAELEAQAAVAVAAAAQLLTRALIEPHSATQLPGRLGLGLWTSGSLLPKEKLCCRCPPPFGAFPPHPVKSSILVRHSVLHSCVPPLCCPRSHPVGPPVLCLRPSHLSGRNPPRGPTLGDPLRGWVSIRSLNSNSN